MTFDLLNQLGLSGFDFSYLFIGLAIISLILLILIIIQMVQIGKLKKNYKKFMGGKDIKSLENLKRGAWRFLTKEEVQRLKAGLYE